MKQVYSIINMLPDYILLKEVSGSSVKEVVFRVSGLLLTGASPLLVSISPASSILPCKYTLHFINKPSI